MDFSELYELERQARKDGNSEELKNIFMKMISLCGDDREVVSLIRVLSARRGQDRNSIRWLVNHVYSQKKINFPNDWTDFAKDLLSDVVEGKMFLEEERVLLTTDLKNHCLKNNNITEALNLILNVPVETFTMIPESTIINYQLEQFRLCVETKDWIRSDITMRKIRKKYFKENKAINEEILFYKYIIDLYLGQEKFYEASITYSKLNEIVDNSEYTILASFYAILCTCEGEVRDIREERKERLKKLKEDKNNEEGMRIILDKFLSDLIISKEIIENLNNLNMDLNMNMNYSPFILRSINEHNFFIIEKFYSSISLRTCIQLLDLDLEILLDKINFMVNNKMSKAKINQKEGIIVFGGKEWSNEVGEVLNKIIRVDHLIHKEKLK
jgi:26S proteasome regulatory subunit N5